MHNDATCDLFCAVCASVVGIVVCPFLPGWVWGCCARRLLVCCKGKALYWFSVAGQKAMNAAGAQTPPCWPEGKLEGLGLPDLC